MFLSLNIMKIDYLELAKSFFLQLKKELQQEDSDSMGGSSSKDFNINGFEFEIFVNGFWEKTKFFGYKVIDKQEKELEKGEYSF